MSSAQVAGTSPTTSTTAADQLSQMMSKSKPDAETGSVPDHRRQHPADGHFFRLLSNLRVQIAHQCFDIRSDEHISIPSQSRMLFHATLLLSLDDAVAANAPNAAEFIGTNKMLKIVKVESI